MFHKILVAVDESESSHRAVTAATDLALQFHASVCLLHAYPQIADYLGSPIYEQLVQVQTLEGDQFLQTLRMEIDQATNHTVPVETQLLEGAPTEAILKVAEAEDFDLIVVGSHGKGPFANLLLGSVSQTLTRKAPCPVMVIH